MLKRTAVSLVTFLCLGCAATHPITLLSPDKRPDLLNTSQNVVEGTLVDVIAKPDMTVGEELDLGGAPSKPANGWKHDYAIKVEHVVRGVCNDSQLTFHDTKDSDHTGDFYPQLGIQPGAKVYVGWQSEAGGNYIGLKIVSAGDAASTRAAGTH